MVNNIQELWEKRKKYEYGFKILNKLIGCSKEELIKRCSRQEIPNIKLVWTPEYPELVPPEKVSFLFNACLKRGRQEFLIYLITGICWIIILVSFYLLKINVYDWPLVFFILVIILYCILPIYKGIKGLLKIKHSPENFLKEKIDNRS